MHPPGWRAAILVCTAIIVACEDRRIELRLATTTSVDNSGLLGVILPAFEQDAGLQVKVLAVGSGRAIQLLRRGDADVAITHDPVAETALLRDVPGARYRKIMFNDFLIVGPPDDPAGISQALTAVDAMRRVSRLEAYFASRGDESGTHAREQQLWAAAGVRPRAARLLETGQGMAPTLRIASERGAYTLTDRATFMQLSPSIRLRSHFADDPDLLNTYAAVVLPRSARESSAVRLMTWMGEGDGRSRIAAFSPPTGLRPFTVWPADRPNSTPDALPR